MLYPIPWDLPDHFLQQFRRNCIRLQTVAFNSLDGSVTLADGAQVPIARRRRKEIAELIQTTRVQ